MAEPTYLGDAVYACVDQFGDVVLTTGDHRPEKAEMCIYLEPEVMRKFLAWVEEQRTEVERGR